MKDLTDLREKAALLIQKTTYKEGIQLTKEQESLAVSQLYNSFLKMSSNKQLSPHFSHHTIRMLLKVICEK